MPPADAATWLAELRGMATVARQPATSCVRLLGFPVALGEQQSERSQELMRELRILLIGRQRGDSSMNVPARLVELTDSFVREYGGTLAGATSERQDARSRGDERIDLEYPIAFGSRETLLRYAQAMDDMDDFCRTGAVMTLPTPPEMVALRRWIVEEFVRQYDGLPPRPWVGPLA